MHKQLKLCCKILDCVVIELEEVGKRMEKVEKKKVNTSRKGTQRKERRVTRGKGEAVGKGEDTVRERGGGGGGGEREGDERGGKRRGEGGRGVYNSV